MLHLNGNSFSRNHRILDLGFEKDVTVILNAVNAECEKRQNVLLSATLTEGELQRCPLFCTWWGAAGLGVCAGCGSQPWGRGGASQRPLRPQVLHQPPSSGFQHSAVTPGHRQGERAGPRSRVTAGTVLLAPTSGQRGRERLTPSATWPCDALTVIAAPLGAGLLCRRW